MVVPVVVVLVMALCCLCENGAFVLVEEEKDVRVVVVVVVDCCLDILLVNAELTARLCFDRLVFVSRLLCMGGMLTLEVFSSAPVDILMSLCLHCCRAVMLVLLSLSTSPLPTASSVLPPFIVVTIILPSYRLMFVTSSLSASELLLLLHEVDTRSSAGLVLPLASAILLLFDEARR